jgi:hypothetical protein
MGIFTSRFGDERDMLWVSSIIGQKVGIIADKNQSD